MAHATKLPLACLYNAGTVFDSKLAFQGQHALEYETRMRKEAGPTAEETSHV